MTDATTSVSPSPQDQGAQSEVDTSQTDNLDHSQGADDQGDPPVEETEEVELSGKKYVVPKEVARGILREADYTRKTQKVAEDVKAFEAERAAHSERVRADAQLLQDNRDLVAIEWQIQALQGMDPQEFHQLSPERQNQVLYRIRQLEGDLNNKRQEYAQKIEARKSEAERARATRKDQALAEIAREVKDWNPTLQETLKSVASKEFGVTPQEFEAVLENPKAMRLLHLANIGLQAQAKAAAAVQQTTTQPAPTRTVSGGGTSAASGLSDRLSMAQWIANRNKQLQRR